MSTIQEYKNAMSEYSAALRRFEKGARFIRDLGAAIGPNPDTFLEQNFGKKSRYKGTADHRRSVIDLTAWPTRDEFEDSAKKLSDAFNTLQLIWQAMSDDDREYLKSPPSSVSMKLL